VQTTKTTPRRLTILHFSHIRRTLARTFMIDKLVAATDHAFDRNGGVFAGAPKYKIAADRSQGGAFQPLAR
jgi:hypothetical protein